MRRTLTILLIIALFAGCSTDGTFRKVSISGGPCGDVSGYTVTGILYGDSKLVVIPISIIRANTEWRFYLHPMSRPSDPDDYRTVNVTIKGKIPADPPLPPDHNIWITTTTGTYNGTAPKHYITLCVPATLTPNEQFQYMVDVDKVGELDPRAKVK